MGMRPGEVLPAREGSAAGTGPPDRRCPHTTEPPLAVAMACRAWQASRRGPRGIQAPRVACNHLRRRTLGQVAAGREPQATDCQRGRTGELHARLGARAYVCRAAAGW
eukprot:9610476-Alexandrium_andersonii.AAC.1